MLRGFRWQFLALMAAVILFGVSLVVHFTENTSSDGNPTQPPPTMASATFAPTNSPVMVNAPTLIPPVVPVPDSATFKEGLVGNVQRLNPLFVGLNPVDADITALIFEGLTRINGYGEVEPALALEWVVSFDGLEYMVTLRDDVLWQDGISFSAADVVYTISLLSSPDFPGLPELGVFWRTVEVEQINDHLVRFRLAQPLASFPEALRIGILPYHVLQGTPASELASHPFNLAPIGTGPYQLEVLRIENGQIRQVDLRVAPVYRQRPEGVSGYALERVSFYLYNTVDEVAEGLRNEEIDSYATRNRGERLSLLTLPERVDVYTGYEPVVGMLIFNWVNDDFTVFRELRVRQALARGLDRTSLIERHLLNVAVPADSPILPLSWAYNYGDEDAIWPSYDQTIAQELLATAHIDVNGADEPESTTLFGFSILVLNDPAMVNMALEVAAQWAQLNLDVSVEAVEAETYQQRLESAQFDVVLVELSTSGSADPDVYSFWHQGQYPDGKNYGGANDRAISESLERARRDSNGIHRRNYYSDFQRDFVNHVIAIPLFYPLYTYAVNSSVTGVQLGFIASASDRFMMIGQWAIVE
jgi:peptide/nickel transport system substrate-binding protein